MARTDLTASMVTAIERDFSDACHLISLEFSGGTLYFNTGSNDIVWDGHTWTAIGGNLAVEQVSESRELTAQSVRVTLDGVNQSVISALLAQNFIGRTCQVYLLHISSAGAIVADPYLLFQGFLNDPFEIHQTEETCTVATRFVSPLTRFDETRGIKATTVSHQQHYDGDTFFRHLKGIANRKIYWPNPTTPGGGGGGSGGGGGGDDDRGTQDE